MVADQQLVREDDIMLQDHRGRQSTMWRVVDVEGAMLAA